MNVAAQAPAGNDEAVSFPAGPGPGCGVESVDARSPWISEVPAGPTSGPTGAAETGLAGATNATSARPATIPRTHVTQTYKHDAP